MRSKVYLYYLANYWQSLAADQRKKYAEWACEDAHGFNVAYASLREGGLIYNQAFIYLKRSMTTSTRSRPSWKQFSGFWMTT